MLCNATPRSKKKTTRIKRQLALTGSSQKTHRRRRTNVLRACQQRVGFYTKCRAGFRREAVTGAQLDLFGL